MSDVLTECSHCVQLAIDGLLAGDRRQLDHAWRRSGDLKQSMERKELVFVRVLKRVKPEVDDHLLGQGTIYPDTIETGGTKRADVIKTHHNRVPIIEEMITQGKVVEPLADRKKVAPRLAIGVEGRELRGDLLAVLDALELDAPSSAGVDQGD